MNNYLLCISSLFILNDELNKLIDRNSNVIYLNYDELKIDDIIMECGYSSFIDSSKIIIVKNFKLNEDSSKILNYLESPNKGVSLILITNLLDKRTNLYKKIRDKINVIEIKDLKVNDIVSKVNVYLRNNNIKIDYNTLNKIIINNSSNIDLVISEIDKISIVSKNINDDIYNEYASKLPLDDSFELCDAIVEKRVDKINDLLDEFIYGKKEVIPFIALLAMQYRYIYACLVTGKSSKYLMDLFKVKSDYPFVKASSRVKLYSKNKLEDILGKLADADFKLKSSDIDKYIILKKVIGEIL